MLLFLLLAGRHPLRLPSAKAPRTEPLLSLTCPSTPSLQGAVLPLLFTALLEAEPELSVEEDDDEQVEEDGEEAPS